MTFRTAAALSLVVIGLAALVSAAYLYILAAAGGGGETTPTGLVVYGSIIGVAGGVVVFSALRVLRRRAATPRSRWRRRGV